MAEGNNFKYKYPGYLANNETVTSAKLNSIVSAINTLIENLMNHDHNGVTDAYDQTTRGPKLIGYNSIEENSISNECLVDETIESNKIKERTLNNTKINFKTITNEEIADETITSNQIKPQSIEGGSLADATITQSKIHSSVFDAIFDMVYPIGSVYITLAEQEICPLEAIRGSWYPIAKGKVLQGAKTLNELGTELAAGLPNITGTFPACVEDQYLPSPTGAFYMSGDAYEASGRGNKGQWLLNFNASRSNPIFGNSDTVQSPALLVNIFKRIEDNIKIINIICHTSGSKIVVTVNGQSRTFQNGEAYLEVHKNDTYSYEITKDNYIREYKSGIVTDNIYYETTLQLSSFNINLYQPSNAVNEAYSYSIKHTGVYQITLGGGSTISGALNTNNTSNCYGGYGKIKLTLESGSILKLYSIKGGFVNTTYNSNTIICNGGIGVGVKLNDEWLCVVGGAAGMRFIVRPPDQQIPSPRPWFFVLCSGGGYLGGTIDSNINVPVILGSSKGYNALDEELGTGTANTNGSGQIITPSTDKHIYGGSGYLNSNYNYISSTMTSHANNGDAYINIEYQGQ